MSIRSTITGAAWTQIGTGPATVQVISDGISVMVTASTAQPATNSDGLVMGPVNPVQHFSLAQAIWAQVVNPTASAVVACQPETT